jgi:hypothetical protein
MELAGGLYCRKDHSNQLAAKIDPVGIPIWLGAGCLLVRRSLAERLPAQPWSSAMVDGTFHGEDVMFCKRARDAGVATIGVLDVQLRHWGLHGY